MGDFNLDRMATIDLEQRTAADTNWFRGSGRPKVDSLRASKSSLNRERWAARRGQGV